MPSGGDREPVTGSVESDICAGTIAPERARSGDDHGVVGRAYRCSRINKSVDINHMATVADDECVIGTKLSHSDIAAIGPEGASSGHRDHIVAIVDGTCNIGIGIRDQSPIGNHKGVVIASIGNVESAAHLDLRSHSINHHGIV